MTDIQMKAKDENNNWYDIFPVSSNGIVDSGSNENGHYVKFADGTMFCRFKTTLRTTSGNQMLYQWVFPEPFINNDLFVTHIPTMPSGNSRRNLLSTYRYLDSNTGDRVTLSLISADDDNFSDGYELQTLAFAMGRWK